MSHIIYNSTHSVDIIIDIINSSIYNTVLSLLLLIMNDSPKKQLSASYKQLINNYTLDSSNKESLCFRCVILGYYNDLYVLDDKWVRINIFTFLEDIDTKAFRFAWTGLLNSHSSYNKIPNHLHRYYIYAIDRLNELTKETQEMFVQSLTLLIAFSKANQKKIMNKIFYNELKSLKTIFLEEITTTLMEIDKEERIHFWKYWLLPLINDINNNVYNLNTEELLIILKWIPFSECYFDKFINKIIYFPSLTFNDINMHLITDIINMKVRGHDKAMAKFLIFVLQDINKDSNYIFFHIEEIFKNINFESIPNLKDQIENLFLKYGIDFKEYAH